MILLYILNIDIPTAETHSINSFKNHHLPRYNDDNSYFVVQNTISSVLVELSLSIT